MAQLTLDTDPLRYAESDGGDSWNRGFLITGLENGPSVPALIAEAMALLPAQGDPAPAPLTNLFVREVSIERISQQLDETGNRWEAVGAVLYTTPTSVGGTIGLPDDTGDGITVSSISSVEEVETDLDRTGAQITTAYDGVTMAHSARSFRTGRTLTFARLESSNPRARQSAHEGTLNAFAWNGYGAETVLLQTMDWETDDQGASYRVQYTFAVRDDWRFRAVHEDPFWPGRPLPGATGAAVTVRDMLPTSDFGLLSITLP